MDKLIDEWSFLLKTLENAEYDYEYLSMDDKELPEVKEHIQNLTIAENNAREALQQELKMLDKNEKEDLLKKYKVIYEAIDYALKDTTLGEKHKNIKMTYSYMLENKQILKILEEISK